MTLEPLEVRPHWQVSSLGQAFGVRSWPLVLVVFFVQAHHDVASAIVNSTVLSTL